MNTISAGQLKCLNTLVSKFRISKEDKEAMVFSFSAGRATSSKDLLLNEATAMIKYLKTIDPCEKMRKKVFALAYEAGMIYGDTLEDKKMNAVKINYFLKERGVIKKELREMNNKELIKVVTQFELITKHQSQTSANKATKSLLEELNIPVEKSKAAKP